MIMHQIYEEYIVYNHEKSWFKGVYTAKLIMILLNDIIWLRSIKNENRVMVIDYKLSCIYFLLSMSQTIYESD